MTDPTSTPANKPDKPPRFLVFKAEDYGWVLRDNRNHTDYPFLTKPAAIGGMERRLDGWEGLGSPAKVNAYGEPLESVEEFA